VLRFYEFIIESFWKMGMKFEIFEIPAIINVEVGKKQWDLEN